MDDLRAGAGDRDHLFGKITHGKFRRITEIDRRMDDRLVGHKADETIDQVGDVAERARLGAIAIDRDVLAPECLDDEIGYDAAVVGAHARPIGVEDAGNPDVDAVLSVKVTEKRFGGTLAFVVARAGAEGIDVAPIVLRLRMYLGISIDLRGGGLEDARSGDARLAPAG